MKTQWEVQILWGDDWNTLWKLGSEAEGLRYFDDWINFPANIKGGHSVRLVRIETPTVTVIKEGK